MHVLSAPTHAQASALPRAIAIVGESPLVFAAERAWLTRLRPVRVVRLDEESRLSLAEVPLSGSQPVLLRGGVEHLAHYDVPALTALSKHVPVVATGPAWGDAAVKEWWESKNGGIHRVYDSVRTSTPGLRVLLEKWVIDETKVSMGIAKYVCRELGYEEGPLAEFVARARFFSDTSMTSSEADLLMLDLRSDDLTEAVLSFQGRRAIQAARTAARAEIQSVFSALPSRVVLMSRIHPAVMRFPKPSVEASQEVRVPLNTLSRFWAVAGRYGPAEVVYRLRLISTLSENSPRDFAALVTLVSMW